MTAPDVTSAVERVRADAEVMSDEINDLVIRVVECPHGDRARYTGDIGRDLRTILSELDRLSAALGEAGLRAADLIGSATHQVSVTVTITARGDETHADLRSGGLSVLAGFECAGGLNRIRVGDPVLGAKDRFHTADRQAHAAFVRHSARTALQQQEARDGRE